MQRNPWKIRLRMVVFTLLIGWMVGGPCCRQVLHVNTPVFRQWVMFYGFGRDICDVEYQLRAADGSTVELDRFEVLGEEDWHSAPRSLKRITSLQAAEAVGRKLCRALEAPDVRLYARCGHYRGWRTAATGEENLCEGAKRWRRR